MLKRQTRKLQQWRVVTSQGSILVRNTTVEFGNVRLGQGHGHVSIRTKVRWFFRDKKRRWVRSSTERWGRNQSSTSIKIRYKKTSLGSRRGRPTYTP